jgi:hypothetical protein
MTGCPRGRDCASCGVEQCKRCQRASCRHALRGGHCIACERELGVVVRRKGAKS